MSGFTAVGFFLVGSLFGIITLTLWIRIALRYYRISTLNQFSQMICSLTDPVLNPINRLFKIQLRKYDWICFAVLVLVEFLKIICLSLLVFSKIIPFPYICIYVVADLIIQPLNLLFYAIIIRVVMSYTNPNWRHPVADFLYTITEPLFVLGRRIVPNISGFDFSPFIMMMILKIITLFISNSLPWRIL